MTLTERLSSPHLPPLPMEERLERMEALLHALIALHKQEQWATQADYAKKYGMDRITVYKRKPYLRRIGAVKGSGKLTRYNLAIAPSGERAA